jgi:hypothetical protein
MLFTLCRDGNSGTGIQYPPGTRPDGYGYEDDFLLMGDTRTRLQLRRIRDMYFFSPVGNLTGTRYFTTAIILGCEQVKICSFYYINYDMFWLLILLLGYLKYLLNINFEHVYIVIYSLN